MSSEVEQEEIITEFLNRIEQKETDIFDEFLSVNETEEDDSCGFATEKRLEKIAEEHCKMIKQIETKKYIPLKNAVVKFLEQANNHFFISNAKNTHLAGLLLIGGIYV